MNEEVSGRTAMHFAQCGVKKFGLITKKPALTEKSIHSNNRRNRNKGIQVSQQFTIF